MSDLRPVGRRSGGGSVSDVEQQAADWVARADRGPLSADENTALALWAAADPRNAGAYARAAAANLHLDRMAALGGDWLPTDDAVPTYRSRRAVIWGGGVVSLSALLGIGGYTLLNQSRTIESGFGEVRRSALPDGSAVVLNTATQLRTNLSAGLRSIDLVQGEAIFDVVRDTSRPFIVDAGRLAIRTLVALFTVHLKEDGAVAVAVQQGIVEVLEGQTLIGAVGAGELLTAPATGTPTIRPIAQEALTGLLAWRDGRIDLTGLTLGQAAAEFARYSPIRIEIADDAVARMRVSGIYAANDPKGFARAVALALGLRSEDSPKGVSLKK